MRALARLLRLGALVVAMTLTGPTLAGAQTGDRAFGSGEVLLTGFDAQETFNFDARSGPLGENPTGTFQFEFSGPAIGDGSVAGDVTCLQVTGNHASIGGHVTSATGDFAVFEDGAVTFSVLDTSPSTPVPDSISAFAASPPEAGPPPSQSTPFCAAPQGTQFLVDGEITVQDDTGEAALPVSKEQCADGGYQAFVVFKNKGDCVAFVASKGKNAPSG